MTSNERVDTIFAHPCTRCGSDTVYTADFRCPTVECNKCGRAVTDTDRTDAMHLWNLANPLPVSASLYVVENTTRIYWSWDVRHSSGATIARCLLQADAEKIVTALNTTRAEPARSFAQELASGSIVAFELKKARGALERIYQMAASQRELRRLDIANVCEQALDSSPVEPKNEQGDVS